MSVSGVLMRSPTYETYIVWTLLCYPTNVIFKIFGRKELLMRIVCAWARSLARWWSCRRHNDHWSLFTPFSSMPPLLHGAFKDTDLVLPRMAAIFKGPGHTQACSTDIQHKRRRTAAKTVCVTDCAQEMKCSRVKNAERSKQPSWRSLCGACGGTLLIHIQQHLHGLWVT